MILGRIVGEVWATRRHGGLDGRRLVVVRPCLWYAPLAETAHLVAVDELGAALGQDVVVCLGDGARTSLGSDSLPVEAAVMAIVDRVAIGDDVGMRPLTFVDGVAPATLERP